MLSRTASAPPVQRLLDTPPPPAKRCTTCDCLLIRSLASTGYDLPTDCEGRCPVCALLDARECAGCGVHRYRFEREDGPCEGCGDVSIEMGRAARDDYEQNQAERYARNDEAWSGGFAENH